ncbi:precorrin-3B C(17)-methyltransferase [Candidatus Acidulodesulfobacterium sp. H_13]|uniref:precorrin-3B C(17)-methyltransferase n=1 Tax=Candidatus Acidulodesulfobacterium sp. H_13 TaxID=3395470 RepID=UPI003AF67E19
MKEFGKITVIGTGPGDIGHLSKKALDAIVEAETVIGYSSYLKQIGDILSEDQRKMPFNMKDEIERCETVVERSLEGKKVALISGGDAGIYGMSGLLLEIIDKKSLTGKVPIEFIPGIPAFCAVSAAIGAPITNDFCVISLSNLLTPWQDIEKRLRAASMGNFVIIIYNPKSKRRREELTTAKNILLESIEKDRPAAIAKAVTRPDEEIIITTLENIDNFDIVTMNTTIIVGNSDTYVNDLYMITKRGYGNKYDLDKIKKRSKI